MVVREGEASTALVVAPDRCPQPARGWGWMLQLYAARSSVSWGIGDLGDLAMLACWSGPGGADLLLTNPLHAATPGLPQQPSPYSPTSRRFVNPLYLRVEDVAELALGCQAPNRVDRIDRDLVYAAKIEALGVIHAAGLSPARAEAFAGYQQDRGDALVEFATFCALAERHGQSWRTWPAPLRHPRNPAVAAARRELADRVGFHM